MERPACKSAPKACNPPAGDSLARYTGKQFWALPAAFVLVALRLTLAVCGISLYMGDIFWLLRQAVHPCCTLPVSPSRTSLPPNKKSITSWGWSCMASVQRALILHFWALEWVEMLLGRHGDWAALYRNCGPP